MVVDCIHKIGSKWNKDYNVALYEVATNIGTIVRNYIANGESCKSCKIIKIDKLNY